MSNDDTMVPTSTIKLKGNKMKTLTKQEQKAYDFLLESGVTLKDIIEVVIKSNGITGVGLIGLKDDITKQIDSHNISKFSEEAMMSM